MMSIFSQPHSLRLPRFSASPHGWPQDCVLCMAPCSDAVCEGCERDLAWMGPACERCALPLEGARVCGRCTAHPPRFDAARACFVYAFPLDRLVQRFKFAGDLATGRWLGERMTRSLQPQRADLLVVPP